MRARLDDEERGHEDGGAREACQRLPGRPADVRRLCEAVDEEHQAGGDGKRPGRVEVAFEALRLALDDVAGNKRQRCEPDGNVDEEDPLPARVLGEDAAQEHADGGAGAGDRAEDAQRLVPLGAFAERDERDGKD